MRLKIFSNIAIAFLCLPMQLQSHAYAESLMDEGTRHYTDSNFGKAIKCFEDEIKTNPKNAHAHYMMGNIFAELGREQEALQEYQHALRLEPHGGTAQYCQKALASLTHKASPPNASGSASGSGSGSAQEPTHTTATTQNSEISSIRNSANKISSQTNETESHTSEECEARIRDVNRDAERQITDLQREQQARIDERPRYSSRGVVRYDPTADVAAIKEEIMARIEAVRSTQARKIAELRVNYKVRQSAAEDAAITLDRQYINHDQASNVRLSPTGTSIYVRSYETGDEPSGRSVPIALPPAKSLSGIKSPSTVHSVPKKTP